LFNKRDFVCDCGTTRLPATSPCTIRINPETNTKGGVHSEEPSPDNKYNKNFRNRFCGCDCDYDAYKEKGTMFQCLGLGTAETGGCGEDWWHPACVVGLAPDWYEKSTTEGLKNPKNEGDLPYITEVGEAAVTGSTGEANVNRVEVAPAEEVDEEDPPLPPGFPAEDDFEGFICYKCVDANPWIKRYAGTEGFLTPLFRRSTAPSPETGVLVTTQEPASHIGNARKRKSEDDEKSNASGPAKRSKDEMSDTNPEPVLAETISGGLSIKVGTAITADSSPSCKIAALPPAPSGQMSLFFKADFRTHLCRCGDCFPLLAPHPQLLDEETNYEPSISDSDEAGGSTQGSGSIYDRGESALKNVDRVRAIEGVMAYNHLKEKLKPFFQQFAESGKAISAEDIKAHFAKMRGDEQDIKQAGEDAKKSDEDNKREQGGH